MGDVTLEQFDERIASLKSLISKDHIQMARMFAGKFEEASDFVGWLRDHENDVVEISTVPLESLHGIEDGEEAMLLMHSIYYLCLGRRLRELLQNHKIESHNVEDVIGNYSWVAFRLRTTCVPFWPFENTNLPLIDGYQNAVDD